jgi:hypothetical protein
MGQSGVENLGEEPIHAPRGVLPELSLPPNNIHSNPKFAGEARLAFLSVMSSLEEGKRDRQIKQKDLQ